MSNIVKTCVLLVDGTVQDSIVADVEWAQEALGGDWVDTTGLAVGRGYTLVDGEWRHPSPFPSWSWSDGEWHAPVPQPDPVDGQYWSWNEETQEWATISPISKQGED